MECKLLLYFVKKRKHIYGTAISSKYFVFPLEIQTSGINHSFTL